MTEPPVRPHSYPPPEYPPPAYPPPAYPPPAYPPPAYPPPAYPPPAYPPAPGQWQQPRAAAPSLPVEEREYHSFFRTPRWRVWRPIVLVVLGFVAFMAAQTVAVVVALFLDAATGRVPVEDALADMSSGKLNATPAFFLANNVSLALLIPISLLLVWALTGQRPGWLSSVVGGFRWGWFWRCVGFMLPLWLLYVGLEWALMATAPGGLGLRITKDTWVLLIGILLTTPFQAAGEEYAFRGLLNRSAASFFGHRWVSFGVGLVFSSTLFMLAHGAGDAWLNLFYFCFGAIACWLTWRTGGLEAAVAMHVINNVLSEAALPFTDMSDMFNREAGTGSPVMLVGVLVPLIAVGLVEWQVRRHRPTRSSAPAGIQIDQSPKIAGF